ncbi:uncharacterized protein TrAtP1_002429 [Trichoderma atroviride]|uniref:Uncharacterized protein n=1 Tax=Hypocrea atroviridis (strain ATCC 20476 / IMI 206040) TaxID=452589 RepID=G9P1Q0_HYPAI|nr:uncharacterized protein TRIATDRAFT_131158 [Trichoderma atroviride IMI 206040]EHK42549.1 hypothetical protein TRIATDRAFT_131158 [Trichoderma atroviride IMI 206040]UKZ61159.1 hypothetical protein TrAtP1_002429 [Trichoderma atroviride]
MGKRHEMAVRTILEENEDSVIEIDSSKGLEPPFAEEEKILREEDLVLPGTYHHKRNVISINNDVASSVKGYMVCDLDVTRLNKIHKHLWLAGLPSASRALHNQVRVGREIIITESADLHIVWRDNVVTLKPLPDYLLSYATWINTLCKDEDLYRSARGFLYSYTWLISSKSDLRIAHAKGLISEDIKWEHWAPFSAAVVSRIQGDPSSINQRYIYGELRLKRLNLIYRFSNASNFKTMIRGYEYGYHQYSTYFERNFKWVLTAIIYITVVLTAMQVGLATTQLNTSAMFNRVSYGFTLFSILAPLITLVIGAIIMLILAVFNVRHALGEKARSHQ